MLVIFLKNTDYNTKITEVENKLTDHNHDKYIDTPEFNKLAADVFYCEISTSQFDNKNRFLC